MLKKIPRCGIIILACAFLFSDPAWARNNVVPRNSPYRVTSRIQNHFDFDENGYLDFQEWQFYKLYNLKKWKLAKSKRQKLYDLNDDGMLNDWEIKAYKEKKPLPPVRLKTLEARNKERKRLKNL